MADTAGTAREQYPHTTWNFVVILTDASFWAFGLAFVDPVAVLPVLLVELSGSEVVVGLMGALQRAGWLIPQLLAASFVLHRPRKKPFVFYPCLATRLPFLAAAIVLNLDYAATHRMVALLVVMGAYGAFFFGEGLVGPPWHDICARTVPPRLRGRFFGGMQFFGGLFAIAAAVIVRRVLADDSLPFPRDYGRLFMYLFIAMMISNAFLALIREPHGPAMAEAQSLSRIIRSIPSTLRARVRLRRAVIGQLLCHTAGMAVPFYAVYAHTQLHLPKGSGGIFVGAATVGAVGASVVWAFLNDRFGSTVVIRWTSTLVIATPVTALLVPPVARALAAEEWLTYMYAIVFVLNGALWGGMWLGFTNYVLEIAPAAIRPLYLGLQATLLSPAILMPLLGGWLLAVISFESLFAIVAVVGVGAVVYVRRLPEPRRGQGGMPESDPLDGPEHEPIS